MGMSFPSTPKLALNLTPSPAFWGPKHGQNTINWIFQFQMIKLCCEVYRSINFSRKVFSASEHNITAKYFAESVHIYVLYSDFSPPRQLTPTCSVSISCFTITTALIYMCNKPFERALHNISLGFAQRRNKSSVLAYPQ